MSYYPIFLDLRSETCLVVGAGEVGKRKVRGLLAALPARIVVIDPQEPDADKLWQAPVISYQKRPYLPSDLLGVKLVFACTAERSLNSSIAEECAARKILCNIADMPGEGGFHVPAVARRGLISLAVSTDGASPAMAKSLRQDLEQWLDKGYADLVQLLEILRPGVLALESGSKINAHIFRALTSNPLRDRLLAALKDKDYIRCQTLVKQELPTALHAKLEDMFHELD